MAHYTPLLRSADYLHEFIKLMVQSKQNKCDLTQHLIRVLFIIIINVDVAFVVVAVVVGCNLNLEGR